MLFSGIPQSLCICVAGNPEFFHPLFQEFEKLPHLNLIYAPTPETLKKAFQTHSIQIVILDSAQSDIRISRLAEVLILDHPHLIIAAVLNRKEDFQAIYTSFEEGFIHFYLYRDASKPEYQILLKSALKKYSELVINQELVHKVKTYNQKLKEEVKKQTAQLEEALKKRNLYFHFIVHEMKNPLTALEGFLEILSQTPVSEEEKQELLTLAGLNSREMLRMVNTLLEYSRSEEYQMSLTLQEFSWQELLEKNIKAYDVLARKKGIQMILQDSGKVIFLRADREKIEIALSNLLSNAVKYTDRGSIRIRWTQDQSQFQLEIQDTGRGIPPQELDQIFEPYRRSSLSESIKGTGLGLAFTKKIIEAHGGKIEAQSAGKDQGSHFLLTLPMRPDTDPSIRKNQKG